MASYDLTDKVAVVTGGAQGIGFATARTLHDHGAKVAILDLRREDAERAAAEIDPNRAMGLATDVTDRDALTAAVEAIVERFGGIDVLVANAGVVTHPATAAAMDPDAFERVIDVNLYGVWRSVHAVLPEVTRRQGHIVVIASVYAFTIGMGAMPYAISKAGVEQLGRALRAELAPHGASASVAYFGFIDTHMVHEALDEDPISARMLGTFPRFLHKRLPPSAAGRAIVRGIERRQPRIIRPHRWIFMSTFRGLLNPLIDARVERDAEAKSIILELDGRKGEARLTAGPEEPKVLEPPRFS